MSDSPKFEVFDRRKFKADQENESTALSAAKEAEQVRPEAHAGPQLVINDSRGSELRAAQVEDAAAPVAVEELAHEPAVAPTSAEPQTVESDSVVANADAADAEAAGLPPAPTAEESLQQAAAYDAAAERLEQIIRAQNPAVGPQPAMTFANLVQQFYVSAMIQMGAGAQEGQRPRVDILGARTTIDMLVILAEKTRGQLTPEEDRTLQSVLYEVRFAFLELTSMISLQAMQPPQPPPPGKR